MSTINLNIIKTEAHVSDEPQLIVREAVIGREYPVEALGPLRDITEVMTAASGAPLGLAANSALSVASLVVQSWVDVETADPTVTGRPTGLYCMTVASSGERKSTCYGAMLKPLKDHEAAMQISYDEEMAKYYDEAEKYEGRRRAYIKIEANPNSSSKEMDKARQGREDLGSPPERPKMPKRTTNEPTYEGLVDMYRFGSPSLGIFSDEGSQLLGGYAMSKDNGTKTMGALCDLWTGSPITRTRKGDGKSHDSNQFTLVGRRLAVHIMAQPMVVDEFLSDEKADGIGFTARFLTCRPETTMGSRTQDSIIPPDSRLDDFQERMTEILSEEAIIDANTGGLEVRTIMLCDEGRKLIRDYCDEVEIQTGPSGKYSSVAGVAGKAAEQACRIAGVLTAWEDIHAPEVPIEYLRNGIALADYYLSEALRQKSSVIVAEHTAHAEELRVWLRDGWDRDLVTTRDIVRRGPNSLRTTEVARKALRVVEEHGWVTAMTSPTTIDGHNRKEVWKLHERLTIG